MRRQKGSTESSGAVIPKAEGLGAESFEVLSNPFSHSPQHCYQPLYQTLSPQTGSLRSTALVKGWMRWELDDTQKTCQNKTTNNQVEAIFNKKLLLPVLIKLYTSLLPPILRKGVQENCLLGWKIFY